MVERAFAEAIATQGIVPGTGAYARAMVHVHRSRGCPKIEVFRGIFPDNEAQAQAANLTFERSYEGAIGRAGLTPMPGTVEALEKLRDAGIKICLITGFSRVTLSRVLSALSWSDKVDLALCPEDAGRGRPMPNMVLTAVLRLGIEDVRHVAVAGDSESDMLCGRRSGASVVAGYHRGPQQGTPPQGRRHSHPGLHRRSPQPPAGQRASGDPRRRLRRLRPVLSGEPPCPDAPVPLSLSGRHVLGAAVRTTSLG